MLQPTTGMWTLPPPGVRSGTFGKYQVTPKPKVDKTLLLWIATYLGERNSDIKPEIGRQYHPFYPFKKLASVVNLRITL